MNIALFTFQKPGHDLTNEHLPLSDYSEPGRPYFEISQFLQWEHWAWCFPEMGFFINNDWTTVPIGMSLWVLSVPSHEIKWLGLNAYCENSRPVEEMFFYDPVHCLEEGDIPQGLVRMPLNPKWVVL